MSHGLLQILITVWVGVHPVTYTLPHQYSLLNDDCQRVVNQLASVRKRNTHKRMTIECVRAVGSEA